MSPSLAAHRRQPSQAEHCTREHVNIADSACTPLSKSTPRFGRVAYRHTGCGGGASDAVSESSALRAHMHVQGNTATPAGALKCSAQVKDDVAPDVHQDAPCCQDATITAAKRSRLCSLHRGRCHRRRQGSTACLRFRREQRWS